MSIDALKIIYCFYPEDTALRRILLKHSTQVCDKALEILKHSELDLDSEFVSTGAMLHDVGIYRCHAPSICCEGDEPYIAHGIIGGQLLREYGLKSGIDLEPFARICERHTGTGLTKQEIVEQGLPLPHQDFLPETTEEKLICLADKFFSKSGNMQEKPFEKVRHSMEKFGYDSVDRFDQLCRIFHIFGV